MKLHNPLPTAIESHFTQAASILEHFMKGSTKLDAALIPTKILENARGLAILTIVKAGFLWSGRVGSGIVVARLPDGTWSAPSAIIAVGAGLGAQLGAEVTDFVFVLNNHAAVRAFSHGGNLTLGGSISVAAGPTGRTSEVAGSVVDMAPIYSYSKSKGLFAGVSIEGTVIITRKEANRAMYGKNVTPAELLSGKAPAPPQAEPLYRMLNSSRFSAVGQNRIFNSGFNGLSTGDHQHNGEAPRDSSVTLNHGEQRESASELYSRSSAARKSVADEKAAAAQLEAERLETIKSLKDKIIKGSTLKRDVDASPCVPTDISNAIDTRSHVAPCSTASSASSASALLATYAPSGQHHHQQDQPQQSNIIKPPKPALRKAIALYDYVGERPTDLSFKAGDVIWIVKSTARQDDWWTGKLGSKQGDFPAN
eukprot:jgi/Hompol1/6073/HPOL_002754-RA